MSHLTHKLIERLKIQTKICMRMIILLFVFSATCAFGADILFVVGKKDMRPGDLCIKNHLEQRGFDVIVMEDTRVKTEDALESDLIILSESARSREIKTKFREIAVPVICSEPWIFYDLGMTGKAKRVDLVARADRKTF